MPTDGPGTLITFYSYKGGTGRSMALANVACLLAKQLAGTGDRILVIDWDLEAPGLHHFFPGSANRKADGAPGLIELFTNLERLFSRNSELVDLLAGPQGAHILGNEAPLAPYTIRDVLPGVDLIKAGRTDELYAARVAGFNWLAFYERFAPAIDALRQFFEQNYAYTLVDSRTGLNDNSGVCTMLLPEKLVGVFTPNQQSLRGLLNLIRQAIEYRRSSNDLRPLTAYPLPSRVDFSATGGLHATWRREYQRAFEQLFQEVYGLNECDLTDYFDRVLLPHVSDYAYGERLAVLENGGEAFALRRAYELFTQQILCVDNIWDVACIGGAGSEATGPTELRVTGGILKPIEVDNLYWAAVDAYQQRQMARAKEFAELVLQFRPDHAAAAEILASLRQHERLAFLQGSLGQQYPITAAGALVGRPDARGDAIPEIDLSREVLGQSVSRRHARIDLSSDGWHIQDLGATNGTAVDGVRLENGSSVLLADGATVLFGPVELTFHIARHGAEKQGAKR